MSGFTDHRIAAPDGLQLFVRDFTGNATRMPVICLPGLTRNHRDFAGLAAHLAPGRRVLCMDFRGRGGSDRDPDSSHYNALVEAQDVVAVLAALGVPKAAFIGTSRGGIVTMLMATLRADLIGAAVLNDIGPRLERAGLARIVAAVSAAPTSYPDWAAAAAAMQAANQSQLPGLTAADWMDFARAVLTEHEGRPVPDHDPNLLGGASLDPDRPIPEMWDQFAALDGVPLLTVRGALSDLFSAETLAEMQARIPTMQAVTVAGRGHVPFLTEPSALAAIDTLLAEADT
jgi:pimeloyl-ACP methyl ester carboxylesterase